LSISKCFQQRFVTKGTELARMGKSLHPSLKKLGEKEFFLRQTKLSFHGVIEDALLTIRSNGKDDFNLKQTNFLVK